MKLKSNYLQNIIYCHGAYKHGFCNHTKSDIERGVFSSGNTNTKSSLIL